MHLIPCPGEATPGTVNRGDSKTMKFARFSIVTHMDRHAAMLEVRDAIYGARGWVEDQVFFSNKAANIRMEMPLAALENFQRDLLGRGLRPHIEGALPTGRDGDVKGSVALTFVHQEPDLGRDVPPFG